MEAVDDRLADDYGGEDVSSPPPDDGGRLFFGGLHRLVVPEEKIDPYDVGEDLDLAGDALALVKRPDKQRWFAILDHYWLETRLLETASPDQPVRDRLVLCRGQEGKALSPGLYEGCRGITMLSFRPKSGAFGLSRLVKLSGGQKSNHCSVRLQSFTAIMHFGLSLIALAGSTVSSTLISDLQPLFKSRFTMPSTPTRSVASCWVTHWVGLGSSRAWTTLLFAF